MKLWFIKRPESEVDYDTFDSAIVAAETEEEAKTINPCSRGWGYRYTAWTKSPENVTATYIGMAKDGTERGIILASFNAG